MKIFSGGSNPVLVDKICERLSLQRGKVKLKSFPSDECFCQFEENIRGADVFLVQSTNKPANNNLMELCVMADAARRASAGRITAVIPYFGYARQDRKERSRVPISAKLVMDLLKTSGFNRILTMDIHAAQIGGFTNLPFDHLSFMPALLDKIKEMPVDIFVAPDIGAVKRNNEYAVALKKGLAIIDKRRLGDTEVEAKNFIGDVSGKHVVIIDDLTESVGTLIEAGSLCKEKGAKSVIAAVTHGCFSDDGLSNLCSIFRNIRVIDRLYYSNTTSVVGLDKKSMMRNFQCNGDVMEIDVSSIFARAIRNIHQNESVSELFSV